MFLLLYVHHDVKTVTDILCFKTIPKSNEPFKPAKNGIFCRLLKKNISSISSKSECWWVWATKYNVLKQWDQSQTNGQQWRTDLNESTFINLYHAMHTNWPRDKLYAIGPHGNSMIGLMWTQLSVLGSCNKSVSCKIAIYTASIGSDGSDFEEMIIPMLLETFR